MRKSFFKCLTPCAIGIASLMPIISCGSVCRTSNFNYVPSIKKHERWSPPLADTLEEYYSKVVENNQIFIQDFLYNSAQGSKNAYEELKKEHSNVSYSFTVLTSNLKIVREKGNDDVPQILVTGLMEWKAKGQYTDYLSDDKNGDRNVTVVEKDYAYDLNGFRFGINYDDMYNYWFTTIALDGLDPSTWSVHYKFIEKTTIYSFHDNEVETQTTNVKSEGNTNDSQEFHDLRHDILMFKLYYYSQVRPRK